MHAGVGAAVVVRAEGLGTVAVAAMVAAVAGNERSECDCIALHLEFPF
jgi:hypothetical protein